MPVRTLDVLTSTSLGTGTTKTQINGGNDYFVQGVINAIHSLSGWHASTGATTAGETYKPVMSLESADITPNISPIHYAMAGQAGGLGTTTAGIIPSLDAIPVNIACKPGNRLQGHGQYLTANTVAGRLGMTMTQSNSGTGGKRRAFWEVAGSPTGTAAGTAAAAVDGSNITVTAWQNALKGYMRFYPTTVTASEDYIGYSTLSSDNWESEVCRFGYQPIGTALGTLITVGDLSAPDQRFHTLDRTFKGSGQYLIQTQAVIAEALQGNGTFIHGIAGTKSGVN